MSKVLVTGGAGFVGSNIVESLLKREDVELVRVLDDFSTGYVENVKEFKNRPKYEFIEGSITDYNICIKALREITHVSHQAALGSVPRSIENPIRTNEVNVGGTLNLLHASKELGVSRIVLAFSSSTYGDEKSLPKVEHRIGRPLSPYAATKLMCEYYAEVFSKTFGLDYVGLRYFNIYGPRQNPDNPYAAVIPIFCKAYIKGSSIVINGDGMTSRDFTYVDNAVQANLLSLFTTRTDALNQVYNVACGEQTTLLEMVNLIRNMSNREVEINHAPERRGDVKHSMADISKIKSVLGYEPTIKFEEGIRKTYEWYKHQYKLNIVDQV